MNGQITVYYALPSPPCRSLIMLAKALGIKCNLKAVNLMAGEHMTPEFLKMNPLHTVPTIVEEDGFTLWESRAAMKYLVDQYGKDDVYFPKEPRQAALVNSRLYFDATVLTPRLGNYYAPVIWGGKQPDNEKAQKYEEALGWLDGFLEKNMWVAGQQITIADFSIIANITTADALGFDISTYQNVDGWYERTRKILAPYGYEEINQEGANIMAKFFKSQTK